MSVTVEPMRLLTESDRCDRCQAQAYVRAQFLSGSTLLFCAHHFRENAAALDRAGAIIRDETNALTR